MPKALIIAEKPSVAADLARALAKAPGMKPFVKEVAKTGDLRLFEIITP